MIESLNSRQGLDIPINEEKDTEGCVDRIPTMLQGFLDAAWWEETFVF